MTESSATSAHTHIFQLYGVRIRATADTEYVAGALRQTLIYKGATPDERAIPADITLDFSARHAPAAPPDSARRLGETEHGNTDIWQDDAGMYLCCEDSTVVLDPGEGRAQGQLGPTLTSPTDRRRNPLFYLITTSLVILLRYQGWFPLHAAALARGNRGILLTARSDSGKSTTALNLVRQGWSYLSDDTVLLRTEAGPVQAHSFRTDFCVDPEAVDLFPELGEQTWPPSLSDATKWRVDGASVYPGQFTPTCIPRVVVVPSIADCETSTLSPVDRKVVLGHLFRQSALTMTPERPVVEQHLELLKQLIHQADTYRLDAGRDALNTPEVIDRLLAPTLD